MNQTQSRFIINKNAIDYLSASPDMIQEEAMKKGFAPREQYFLRYTWDEDFKKYYRTDAPMFKQILSATPHIHLLLQNIFYDRIKKNLRAFFEVFFKKPVSNQSLITIEHQAVECALIGKILEQAWCKNVVYSIKKPLFFNSPAHSLEGICILLSFEKSPYLQTIADEIINSFVEFQSLPKDLFVFCSENDLSITDKIDTIDPYLKTQIGYKYPPIVLSLQNFIETDFLKQKDIHQLYFFDDKEQKSTLFDKFQSQLWAYSTIHSLYSSTQPQHFWIYEHYAVEENEKFLEYKNDLWKTAMKNAQWKKTHRDTLEEKAWVQNQDKISIYAFIPYWISIIVLLIYLTSQTIGSSTSTSSSTWSPNTWSNFYYFWGSNWGSSLWNTSVWNSTSKSTVNSIKSFGWGGFSKSSG